MRISPGTFFGIVAYLVAGFCFLIDWADLPFPKNSIVALWLVWLVSIVVSMAHVETPKWRSAWVLASGILMVRTTEIVLLVLFWTVTGFAP
jgi:hypothetical protein